MAAPSVPVPLGSTGTNVTAGTAFEKRLEHLLLASKKGRQAEAADEGAKAPSQHVGDAVE